MRKKVYSLVFDGLADWEPALALCEINKSGKFEIITVGFSDRMITTMGGLKVQPDVTLDQIKQDEAAILIIPGGPMWEQQAREDITGLVRQLHAGGVVIAAICGATLEIARSGLMDDFRHTSNSPEYIRGMVSDYRGDHLYVDQLAVCDGNLITASGLGCIEFACEILKRIGLYNETESLELFSMFKYGVVPARFLT